MSSTIKGLTKQISLGLFDIESATDVEKTIYGIYKDFPDGFDVVACNRSIGLCFLTDFYNKSFGDIFKFISDSINPKADFFIEHASVFNGDTKRIPMLVIS